MLDTTVIILPMIAGVLSKVKYLTTAEWVPCLISSFVCSAQIIVGWL